MQDFHLEKSFGQLFNEILALLQHLQSPLHGARDQTLNFLFDHSLSRSAARVLEDDGAKFRVHSITADLRVRGIGDLQQVVVGSGRYFTEEDNLGRSSAE